MPGGPGQEWPRARLEGARPLLFWRRFEALGFIRVQGVGADHDDDGDSNDEVEEEDDDERITVAVGVWWQCCGCRGFLLLLGPARLHVFMPAVLARGGGMRVHFVFSTKFMCFYECVAIGRYVRRQAGGQVGG